MPEVPVILFRIERAAGGRPLNIIEGGAGQGGGAVVTLGIDPGQREMDIPGDAGGQTGGGGQNRAIVLGQGIGAQ